MEIRACSQPAPGRENEDLVFAVAGLVGVLDGVTQPAGLDVGCVHSPAWYVRQLATRIIGARSADPASTLVDLLSIAIAGVRDDHGPACDLSHPGTPAASICLLEQNGDVIDYLVLCDCTLILEDCAGIKRISDDRFEMTVAEIRRQALVPGAVGSAAHESRIARSTVRKWEYTNQPGGYWIAAATPQAAHEAVTGSVPVGQLRRAVLLTDGAARAVDQFGFLDWAGLLDILSVEGPAALIRRVRAAELRDRTGIDQPRYKQHDDATAAVCLFNERE
jgi:hypothetical protein